jgi:hypothetical protein
VPRLSPRKQVGLPSRAENSRIGRKRAFRFCGGVKVYLNAVKLFPLLRTPGSLGSLSFQRETAVLAYLNRIRINILSFRYCFSGFPIKSEMLLFDLECFPGDGRIQDHGG